jgi:hypothetical protein
MNIYDILTCNRVVILADEDSGMLYTWNQSCTLQKWQAKEVYESGPMRERLEDARNWEEVDDVRVLSDAPKSIAEAQAKVKELWWADFMGTVIKPACPNWEAGVSSCDCNDCLERRAIADYNRNNKED